MLSLPTKQSHSISTKYQPNQTHTHTHPRTRSLSLSDPARPERSHLSPTTMFRRATGLLARPIMSSARARTRPFSTDLPATETGDSNFIEAWKKVIPNIDPPKTPLSFMKPRPATPSSIPTKLTVNFVLPYASELASKEVSQISHFLLIIGFRLFWCNFMWVEF